MILNLFLKETFFKFVKFTFLHICTGCSVYNLMKYSSGNNTVLLKFRLKLTAQKLIKKLRNSHNLDLIGVIEWVTVTFDLIHNKNYVIITNHQSHTVAYIIIWLKTASENLNFYTYSKENWTTIIYQLGCGEVLWLYLIDTATAVWCRSRLEP